MRRDSLATLTRLRAIETTQAQAALSTAAAARRDAAQRALRAMHKVLAESPGGATVTYGTWLAHQLALRQQARAAEAACAQREEEARAALIETRRAERIVGMLRESRQEALDRNADRREAAALDEAAARNRPLRPA